MTSPSAATLRSRYVAQAASDLEENRRRQQELAEKIKMLEQEEALLVDILALAERYEGASDRSPLPEQTQGEPPLTRQPGPRSVSRGRAARRAARIGRGPAGGAAKGKSRQPLLGDLLMGLLEGHPEPRPAKELRDELLQRHPDRNPTPQVVRNTLEALVAKGRVRRHKEQRSVMYTLAKSTARATTGSGAGASDDAR
ncbi:hypothetical protein [Streptomyces pseudogriseolus]|uniref:hypothetical protein n=1 Tax=Streptomyces pseudogriseolus TaxID=36817 RepID=UPI001CE2E8A7|nr:hypothetical protein [Streptomyces pseudogriseolus]